MTNVMTLTPAERQRADAKANAHACLYRLQCKDRQRLKDKAREDIIAGDTQAMINYQADRAELDTIHSEEWQRLRKQYGGAS